MNNDELLNELSSRIASGALNRDEVARKLQVSSATPASAEGEIRKPRFTLTKIFYIVGGAVVALGVIFFVAQIWEDIGSLGRILVTLVFGLVFAGLGSMLLVTKPSTHMGEVFHAIGGVMVPGGALVTLYELNHDLTIWPSTIALGVIFLFYLLLMFYHKNAVLTFFAIANGTAFVYLFLEAVVEGPFYSHDDMYAYLTMVVGISYLLLSYTFKDGRNKHLAGFLNFLGSAGFFGAAFSRVFDSGFWEFLFFVFVVGGIALAVYNKSRAVLVVSTLFFIAHLIYITNEYFADSIGWPISLVILGLLFIGVGYVTITLNRKYIRTMA